MAPRKEQGMGKGKHPVKKVPPKPPAQEEVFSDEEDETVEWSAIMVKVSNLERAKGLAPPAKVVVRGQGGHRHRQATTKTFQS